MPLMISEKSDNLIFMKNMSSTDVARNFSAVLDAVAAGEEIEITRGKLVIATLTPAKPRPNAAAVLRAVEEHRDKFGPMDDETLAVFQELLAERHAPHNLVGGELDRDPWQE
jgi:antitoxin (DNA-binding transcriptional repressor) of toxin-antitoxin stability system